MRVISERPEDLCEGKQCLLCDDTTDLVLHTIG